MLAGKLLNEARALRYLIDALDDEASAEVLFEKGILNRALFHGQQVSEKGSKACLSMLGIVLADDHKYADFLQKMVVPSSGKLKNEFMKVMVKVSVLETLYIQSRYGVDKQGRIHFKEFEKKDVEEVLVSVQRFLELCFLFLEDKLNVQLPRVKEKLVLYIKTNYKELL